MGKKIEDNLESFNEIMELIKKYPPNTPRCILPSNQWIHNEIKKEYHSPPAIFSTY